MEIKLYIAGPMTGLPESNYPAFNAAAARLRQLGYHVENPAENGELKDWQEYMRAGIKQLISCDTIVMLEGWEKLKGATIEHYLAMQLGMTVWRVQDAVRYAELGRKEFGDGED